jgi:hypothetical protein
MKMVAEIEGTYQRFALCVADLRPDTPKMVTLFPLIRAKYGKHWGKSKPDQSEIEATHIMRLRRE